MRYVEFWSHRRLPPPALMIRLLATDVDGTLLNSQRQLSDRNRAALHRASEAGIVICLATGRLIPALKTIQARLDIPGPTITCNGAYVEALDGTVLLHGGLTPEARDVILDYSQERNVNANMYQPYRVLATHESPFLEMYRNRTTAIPEILGWDGLRHETATKLIFIDHPAANLRHAEHFEPLQTQYGFDLTVSEPDYLEFLPHGVNKRTGLIALAEHLGVARSEVAAIGDYMNDYEMVTWAGIGAAMGSGAQELKEAADLVVPGNNEDGLAHFVDHILSLQ